MGINDSGRKKLVIVKLLERRKVGEAEVQEFSAKVEGEEATGKHGVWSRALDEYIKVDSTIDCDVVTKKSDKTDSEGNPYWNRKVTQIYIDGKPVAEKKQFGGGYQRPDNTASIESQTAAKIVAELMVAGKLAENDALAELMLSWCKKRLGAPSFTPEKSQPVASKTATATSSPEKQPKALKAVDIYNHLTTIVEFKTLTADQVKKKLTDLGGTGDNGWQMLESLKPDKLADVQKWIDELSKGPF